MNIGLVELPSSFRRVLRFFRESRGTSTQTVNVLRAEGGETNIGVVIRPKGTGAFSLDIPDGTTAGGNARGTNAIDLQTARTAATQVASGSGAVGIGTNCTASGTNSVAIGQAANVTGTSVGIGSNVTATGADCVAIGLSASSTGSGSISIRGTTSGNGSVAITGATASGNNSVALANATASAATTFAACYATANAANATAIQNGNTANGVASTIPGGIQATANSIQGLLAYGFNGTTQGQNQMSFFGGRKTTTNTSALVTSDAATAAATNQLTLRNNSAFRFEGRVISRDTVNNDSKEWAISGLVKRGAAAVNTSLVGTPTVTSTWADTGASAWAVTLSADTTNGSLGITIDTTGTTNAVRTTAVVWSTEVA